MIDKKRNKIKREDAQTPITDGDARPDLVTGISDASVRKKKTRLTHERGADVNSIEDYKDAK